MDRPLDSTPILGYAVFAKASGKLISGRIYATPATAIAAQGVGNYELSRSGLLSVYASPKEYRVARAAAFGKSFEVRPVYAGESI